MSMLLVSARRADTVEGDSALGMRRYPSLL